MASANMTIDQKRADKLKKIKALSGKLKKMGDDAKFLNAEQTAKKLKCNKQDALCAIADAFGIITSTWQPHKTKLAKMMRKKCSSSVVSSVTGIHQATIYRWMETGIPNLKSIIALCDFLKCEPRDLID